MSSFRNYFLLIYNRNPQPSFCFLYMYILEYIYIYIFKTWIYLFYSHASYHNLCMTPTTWFWVHTELFA
uniref:Uncharacterized protein n=1 Tax=Octopus bimaculoides TaxID=37653 RepID=A0A0L8GI42_OCTBM